MLNSANHIARRCKTFLDQNQNVYNAAMAVSMRIMAAFMAYGVQIFLARYLSLEEYGIYVTLWTWLIIAYAIGVFGFSESAMRFLPRYTERKQHAWAIGFLKTGFLFSIVGAFLVAALGFGAIWLFRDHIAAGYILPMMVLAIGLPIMSIEFYFEGISRSFGWYFLTIIPAYAIRPFLIAACVLAAIMLGYTPDAAMVLAFAILITAGIIIAQASIIYFRLKARYGSLKGGKTRKVWITSSLPLVFTSFVEDIYYWSDIIILGFLVPAPAVGIYFAAQRSMSLALFIQYAFMLISPREFSLANANRNRDKLQERVSSASLWTFWMTVPAVALTLIAGYPLLSLFGPEFTQGFGVMAILGLGLVLRASVGQAAELLIVLGHQYANLAVTLSGLVLNIILSIALVPPFGIMGVAIATTIVFFLRAIALTIIVKKLTGLNVLTGMPKLPENQNMKLICTR